MADSGVDIDLYADDIESDFNRTNDFGGDNVDLYDDVISAPSNKPEDGDDLPNGPPQQHPPEETNGNSSYHGPGHGHHGRRFQLYVGNLTWHTSHKWATDQDILNAVADVGVTDFIDVKFFENRANGQSKGFCVVFLGSDNSMRLVMDRLPKREIHGQHPMVTLPTKQAMNQFESQSKTRATPPGPNNPAVRGPHPGGIPGPHPGEFFGGGPNGPGPNGPPGRMMMPGGGPPHHQMRAPPQGPPHHMQHQPGPPPHHMQHQPGPPPPHQGPPPHRPPMQFQGPPQMQRVPGPGPRPEWGPRGPPHHMPQPQYHPPPQHHPPHHPLQPGGPGQGLPPPHQLPPPRPAPPHQHPHPGMNQQFPVGVAPGGPAPHVNPAFFNPQPTAQAAPPHQPGPPGPVGGYVHPGHVAAAPAQGPPPGGRQPYGRPPQNYPPPAEAGRGQVAPPIGSHMPPPAISEAEFEEVMGRNRTVSSSAIARAVSDAAAGEYASAIETLVTAISLIKQSKVAHDDRCKILISSLQDTLHGVETKSYSSSERSRREGRSRSRDREREVRAHHRSAPTRRRERSTSRYRDRSRDREDRYSERSRERDRERDRDAYYRDYRERERERSRSRDRERADHYNRGHSREERPRKSPVEGVAESAAAEPTAVKARTASAPYYDDRYRERRERDPPAAERERDHRRDNRH